MSNVCKRKTCNKMFAPIVFALVEKRLGPWIKQAVGKSVGKNSILLEAHVGWTNTDDTTFWII